MNDYFKDGFEKTAGNPFHLWGKLKRGTKRAIENSKQSTKDMGQYIKKNIELGSQGQPSMGMSEMKRLNAQKKALQAKRAVSEEVAAGALRDKSKKRMSTAGKIGAGLLVTGAGAGLYDKYSKNQNQAQPSQYKYAGILGKSFDNLSDAAQRFSKNPNITHHLSPQQLEKVLGTIRKASPQIKPWHIFAGSVLAGAGAPVGDYLMKQTVNSAKEIAEHPMSDAWGRSSKKRVTNSQGFDY